MKKTIPIIALAVIVLIGAIGLGYYLFQKKKQEMLEATMKGLSIGRAYGKSVAQSECLPALRLQYADCDNHVCEISAHGFIVGCMNAATDNNFCQSVPSPKDATKAVNWANKTCVDLKLQNTKCEEYIHKVLSVCYEKTTGKTRSTGEIFQDSFNRGLEKTK